MSAISLDYQASALVTSSLTRLNHRPASDKKEGLSAPTAQNILGITAVGSAIASTTSLWPLSLAAPVAVLKVFGLDLIRSAFGQRTQPDPANIAFTARVNDIQDVLKRSIDSPDQICNLLNNLPTWGDCGSVALIAKPFNPDAEQTMNFFAHLVKRSAQNPKYLDVFRKLAQLNPAFLLAGLQLLHSERSTPLLEELRTRGYAPGTVLHTLVTEFPDVVIQDRETGRLQPSLFSGRTVNGEDYSVVGPMYALLNSIENGLAQMNVVQYFV